MMLARAIAQLKEASRLWPRYRRQALRDIVRVVAFVNVLIILAYARFGLDRVLMEVAISSCIALAVGWPLVVNRGMQQARIQILADDLRRMALTDALSGLANRRAMFDALALLPDPARAAFICFDIDRFKHVNDTFGHAGGDAVIRDFAAMLSQSLPSGATAARLGGEEFGVLLPFAGLPEALDLAGRITSLARISPARAPNGLPIAYTVSAGCSAGCQTGEHLVLAADEALYRAKGEGRDRVRAA